MANSNNFNSSLNELLKGLDGFVSSRTVVGNPVNVNDAVIIPLMDVQIGVGAGAYAGKTNATGGGMGAKMSPSAVLVISKEGNTRLVNIKNQDGLSRALDSVPDIIDKIQAMKEKKDPEVEKKVKEMTEGEA